MFELLLIPIAVALFTQVLKLIIDGIPNNLSWQHIFSDYGGMPSAHTAFVSALATVIGLSQGFESASFAVAFILMLIVMRDAIGFRKEIGNNSVFTNMLAKEIYKKTPINTKRKIEFLQERIGHSKLQVTVGFIVGVCLTIILYSLI